MLAGRARGEKGRRRQIDRIRRQRGVRRALGGEGYEPSPYYMAPLYPHLLAGLCAVFGHGLTVVAWIRSALGVLNLWMVYAQGRRIDGHATGLNAMTLATLYGPLMFLEALELDPSLASAHYNLGLALHRKGDLEGALAAFRQVARLRPNDAQARHNLATMLDESGRTAEAVAEYQAALALRPDLARTRYNLALALFAAGRFSEAQASLDAARELGVTPDPAFVRTLARRLRAPAPASGAPDPEATDRPDGTGSPPTVPGESGVPPGP